MKILVTLKRRQKHQPNATRRYLINLFTKSLIAEVRGLIGNREYGKALHLVYKEGLFEKEILEGEIPTLKADLILSEQSANWDLKR
jgi:hypothetical protein